MPGLPGHGSADRCGGRAAIPRRDEHRPVDRTAAESLEDCVYAPMTDLRRLLETVTPAEADATVKEQGEYRHASMLQCLLRLDAKTPPTPVSEEKLKRRYNAAVLPALIGSHIPLGHLKSLAQQERPDARRFYRQAQREAQQCQETLSRGYWSRETASDRILWDCAAIFDCRKDHEADPPAGWPLKEPTPFPEATRKFRYSDPGATKAEISSR